MGSRTAKLTIPGLMEKLTCQAGRMLRQGLGRVHHVRYKSEKNLVTEMDQAVENLFARHLKKHFSQHRLLSEEMAESSRRPWKHSALAPGEWRWVLDPLDGTTNYAHRFPHFCVSVGVENHQGVQYAAVYNPMLDEFFYARRGEGAVLNHRPIHVSKTREIQHALLATGFPYDLARSPINNFSEFAIMSRSCQAVRRAGSAALDLCDVACGRFDGFWEYKLKSWDVAAGALILREAGGAITHFNGRGFDLKGGDYIASNGYLHPVLVKTLSSKAVKRRS